MLDLQPDRLSPQQTKSTSVVALRSSKTLCHTGRDRPSRTVNITYSACVNLRVKTTTHRFRHVVAKMAHEFAIFLRSIWSMSALPSKADRSAKGNEARLSWRLLAQSSLCQPGDDLVVLSNLENHDFCFTLFHFFCHLAGIGRHGNANSPGHPPGLASCYQALHNPPLVLASWVVREPA